MGDRRGSNPRPSEPQSADTCFQALPHVAEPAYLSRFYSWWLPSVSGCCALSGVRGGVNHLHGGRRVHTPRHPSSRRLAPYRGVPPKVVTEMLGHPSLSITLGSYRHLIPRLGEVIASAMEDGHAALLTLARLKVLSCHLRLLIGALPARWCDGPGLPRRAPRQRGSPSHPPPLSLKAFSFCYTLRASLRPRTTPSRKRLPMAL
jgi:hypothetical protein